MMAATAFAQKPAVVHPTSTATTTTTKKPAASNAANNNSQPAATKPQAKPPVHPATTQAHPNPAPAHASTAAQNHAPRHHRPYGVVGVLVGVPGGDGPAGAAQQQEQAAEAAAEQAQAAEAQSAANGQVSEQSVVPDPKAAANGRRDPFISPVVQRTGGSGCSTGKKCLEIGEINLKGVVRSQDGFIAVVSNGLQKAYFLRENDPVFNGYVVKITGDSIVFQETLQDRLGKTFTREVTKKITTPAV
jgi:Tfp pilus assembly protein PilP